MENLAQLEALCERLYKSQDSAERTYAENTLRCFSQDTTSIPQLEFILEKAGNPYAVLFASSSLLKLVTENSPPLPLRLQIRNHVITYLAARGAETENFVMTSLIRLLCRVTKFGWFDDDTFREVLKDSMNFLNQEAEHYAIGLKILNQLVSEMNQPAADWTFMQHRKVAFAFKENALLQIYEISLTSLLGLKNDARPKLQELALSLSIQCLSFDFSGISADESSDDVSTVHIPESWKSVLEEPSTLHIYFDYYAITSPPLSKMALECLVRLACVRRTLFTNSAKRMQFLTTLMMGSKDILETGKGLNDHDNYHEFCRFLGRFKVHYQLSELTSVDGYNAWLSLLSDFTLKSLQSWKWASSSVYYLLGLWSRMVTSTPYMKSDSPAALGLAELVPKILEGFISSRFDSLQDGGSDDLSEDPLDKVELLEDQLDFVPYLCRFQYGICSTYIMNIMDPILQSYMEVAKQQDHVNNNSLVLTETKLAWMVHIVGAVLKIKQYSGGESNEIIDAELSARVLQLINVMDTGSYVQRYGELSRQRLELAVLSFIQYFRKTYIGEQAMYTSTLLYGRLSELLGLHDHLLVLDVTIRKIVTNLKCYSESEEILNQTLALFLEMASGYMTAKLLMKLDTMKYITANHSKEHFRFLENYSSRRRTMFYYVIGSLVFMEDSIVTFKQSTEPFSLVFVNLESTPDTMFCNETVKCAFIGLMRDLRGIAMATNSRRTYGFLFDWLYPHMPLLSRAIGTWAHTPEVTTPLLKFVAELVHNKFNRMTFEQSSANGILLFREVSKLLVVYGSRILTLPDQRDVYINKYKGIGVSLSALSRAINGNYVNFGVFELYGDRALDDALDITLKLILSIPAAHIIAYRKVAVAYFSFLEVTLSKYIKFALKLDANTFIYIVRSLYSGLKILDTNLISQCATSIDHLTTFYFDHILMGELPASPALLTFAQHVSNCADVFLDILKTLFEIILFEGTSNRWNLSRPMLSLILLSEEMYAKLKSQILASQPTDKHQYLLQCFDTLMEGVTRSLDLKNRERFTQNVLRFKKDFKEFLGK